MAQNRAGWGHGLTRQTTLWPEQEAPVRIERAKQDLCPDKAARQQTEREQGSTQARAAHPAAGLPALTGTPKQVAWAEAIRAKALASPSNQVPRCATDGDTGRRTTKAATGELDLDQIVAIAERALEVAAAARRELEMQTSARWWIGRRDQVDAHVHRAHAAAARHASPDLRVRPDAGKEAAAKSSRHAPARQRKPIAAQAEMVAHTMTFVVGDQPVSVVVYRSRTEHQKCLAAQAESVAQATTFVVSDHPGAVFVHGSSIKIESRDGRTAHGYVESNQWHIFQIGAHLLDCTHPEAVRIAREAHGHHGARAQAVVSGSLPSRPPEPVWGTDQKGGHSNLDPVRGQPMRTSMG